MFFRPLETTIKENRMADFDVVMEKLHSFETADDLAGFFEGYGIKAVPKAASHCAISKFITEETGLYGVTTSTSVRLFEKGKEIIDPICHTRAMVEFVLKFDVGYYPNLIDY
jgi:hypothetical protein